MKTEITTKFLARLFLSRVARLKMMGYKESHAKKLVFKAMFLTVDAIKEQGEIK